MGTLIPNALVSFVQVEDSEWLLIVAVFKSCACDDVFFGYVCGPLRRRQGCGRQREARKKVRVRDRPIFVKGEG